MAPSHLRPRTVPLRIIAPNMPRTGTSSMAAALEQLGVGHCYHGFDAVFNSRHVPNWQQAVDAKLYNKGEHFTVEEWDDLLGHCGAVTDMPSCCFWEELIDTYPEAKVVLVQRDVDRWIASFQTHVLHTLWTPRAVFIDKYIEPILNNYMGRMARSVLAGYFRADDPQRAVADAGTVPAGMKGNFREVYLEHYERIRAKLANQPERLLEFKLEQGWAPLCEFLEVPEGVRPVGAFPRLNEDEEFRKKLRDFSATRARKAV